MSAAGPPQGAPSSPGGRREAPLGRENSSGARSAAGDGGTILAFDFGTRRIGVAVGNTIVRTAHPLTTIAAEAKAARLAAVRALVAEWKPAALVVGRPVHADGTEHEMTARAEQFARSLEGRFGLPVIRVDERFTTQEAEGRLRERGVRGEARRLARDAVAAQLILQAWFDENEKERPA